MGSLLDELGWKKFIGHEYPAHTGEPVLARDIRRYAYAIDDGNPLFVDEAAAKAGRHGGITAPLNYVSWAVGVPGAEKRSKPIESVVADRFFRYLREEANECIR